MVGLCAGAGGWWENHNGVNGHMRENRLYGNKSGDWTNRTALKTITDSMNYPYVPRKYNLQIKSACTD